MGWTPMKHDPEAAPSTGEPPVPRATRTNRGLCRQRCGSTAESVGVGLFGRFFVAGFVVVNRRRQGGRNSAENWRAQFAMFQDFVHVFALDCFVFEEGFGDFVECHAMFGNELPGAFELFLDDAADFGVDFLRSGFADMRGAGDVAAKENGVLVVAKREWADEVAHAPVAHHAARDFGDLLDVARGAVGDVVHDKFLGDAAAEAHGDLVEEAFFMLREDILFGDEHRAAERTSARDDGDFVDGHDAVVEERLDEGVAGLVVGGHFLFFVVHGAAMFASEEDFFAGVVDVDAFDFFLVASGGEESAFVEKVGQVGAGETGCAAGDFGELHVFAEVDFAGVDFEDLFAALEVGQVNKHLAVEAARAEEGLVEHVGAIGGGDDDDAFGGVETVHFDEHGVERLFAFVVAAAEAGAALASHGVDFVDEDDAGGVFAALFKHVAHAAGADADKHFHEVGARNAEEWHFGFAGHGFGEEGFARAGRADEQDALGDLAAHFLEFFRVFEEFDDFGDFLFGFVAAGDLREGDFFAVAVEKFGAALAKCQRATAGAAELAHEEEIQ